MASFLPQDPLQGAPQNGTGSPFAAPSPSPAPPYDPALALFQPTHKGKTVERVGQAQNGQADERQQQQQQDEEEQEEDDFLDSNSLNNGDPTPVASTSSFIFPPNASGHILPIPPSTAFPLDPSLLPSASDLSPTSKIRLLRQMDEDADAALTANQAYQEQLLEVMKRLDWARKRAGEVAALVTALQNELHDGSELKIVHEHFSEPALPWFKWLYGKDLPPNPDGQARDRYLATIRSIPWSTAERAQLKQEVIAQNHRLVAQEALRRGEDMTLAIASKPASWFSESLEGIDWERIALVVDRRTPTECRIQYTQRDHPLLNLSPKWTEGEKNKLYEVVERFGGRDWAEIARELGTNRTPADCLRQWRRRPGQKKPGGFTKEDDEKIREGVRLFGENWQAVARHSNLTSTQVQTRWTKTLRPSITRGKWSAEEDAALTAAVAAVGKSWKEVEKRVGGRTDAQCRERWTNILDPRLKDKNEWTEEEEATLLRLRDEEGLSWADIAKKGFNETRTDNHCMRRYTLIQRRSLPEHLKPRIGRPPKGSRGLGRPKKTAKRRRKEETERKELEKELDEMDQRDYREWLATEEGEGGEDGVEEEGEEEEAPPLKGKGKGKAKEKERTTKRKSAAASSTGKGKKRKVDALEAVDEQQEEGEEDGGAPQAGPSTTTGTSTSTSTSTAKKRTKKAKPTPAFTVEVEVPTLPSSSSTERGGGAGGSKAKGARGKGKKRAREGEEEE